MSSINETRTKIQQQYDPMVKEIGDTMLHGPLSVSLHDVLEAGFKSLPHAGPNDAKVMLHRLVEEEWRRNGTSPFLRSVEAVSSDDRHARVAEGQLERLTKLAEIPAVGSEERLKWLSTAYHHVSADDGSFWARSIVSEAAILTLMSEARKQGQRDALGALAMRAARSPDSTS